MEPLKCDKTIKNEIVENMEAILVEKAIKYLDENKEEPK